MANISRDLKDRCRANGYMDYEMILSELENLFTTNCKIKNQTRARAFEEIANELREPESVQDEPFETARKMAMVVEAFSNLAHIHSELGNRQEQISLRFQKDQFMKIFAEYCVRKGIVVGVGLDRNGNSTLESDIPYVGHVGWHFGKKTDAYDVIRSNIGVREYPYNVEEKIGENGLDYTNAQLLLGNLSHKQINQTDRNLTMYGRRIAPPKKASRMISAHRRNISWGYFLANRFNIR